MPAAPKSSPTPRARPLLDRARAAQVTEVGRGLANVSWRAAALVALVSLGRTCAAPATPPKSLDGLLESLGGAARVTIKPTDFVWERSEGVVGDFLDGRHVLFLGSEKPGSPRDLFRARVRLTPEGRPLEVHDVVNLTVTPYGDEQGLVRDEAGERAAFATFAMGQMQGVTVLDLRGEGRAAKATSATERAMFWVTNLQETGDGRGIARVQVSLEKEASVAVLRFEGTLLVAQLGGPTGTRVAKVDVDKGDLVTPVDGVSTQLLVRVPKKPIHWAVDTVRAIPWIGPEPIAWLEERVWFYKDRWKQFTHKTLGSSKPQDEVKADVDKIVARPLDASQAGEDGGYWPPQQVPTIFKTPEAGEGEWVSAVQPWMHQIPGAPSPFYRTFVRPDPQRPYSKVLLVAMDTRQLDFDMEAGVDDPKPTVGSFHGTGRIPRDPVVAKKVVAAFNGGFKTEHGHYGMMLHKRVLLPPVPTGATAVVMDDGRFGMGAWSPTKDIPTDIFSYRQNMDPMIEDGIINPRKRQNWGAVLMGQPHLSGQQTERSGLCVTKARHLLYVWGDDVGPEALAKGMQLAGCDFGMHLDMNPFHTGFVFMSFEDAQYQRGKSETLTPLMAISNRRYIDYNPKDFFFAMLRDVGPAAAGGANGGLTWSADDGIQPPPKWLPGIQRAASGGVTLTSFEAGRVRWTVRAGIDEQKGGAPRDAREIDGDDAKRVITAIGLGVADPKRPLGLTLGGKSVVAMATGEGSLVIDGAGRASIRTEGEPVAGAVDVVQGPLLVNDGKAAGSASGGADHVRVGIGLTKDGRVVVARGKVSEQQLVDALLAGGCVRAIGARGAVDGFIARAGTAEQPMHTYPQTTLYGIAQPMLPRAFRFDRAGDGKQLWPVATAPVP